MISVIVCSNDRAKHDAVKRMYESAFGAEKFELIGIHDARSLAEGYNRGVAAAKGDLLAFSHHDVEILSPDLAGRLRYWLERFDLIGVVGTSRLIGPRWIFAGPPHVFGQVCHIHPKGELLVDIYGVPLAAVPDIQALDGLFFAARRSTLQKVSFDEGAFDGFHLYDLDFSFAAYQAGLKLAVVADINLLHQSGGAFDATWNDYANRFVAKWQKNLAPGPGVSFELGGVMVPSRATVLEVMNPPHLREQS